MLRYVSVRKTHLKNSFEGGAREIDPDLGRSATVHRANQEGNRLGDRWSAYFKPGIESLLSCTQQCWEVRVGSVPASQWGFAPSPPADDNVPAELHGLDPRPAGNRRAADCPAPQQPRKRENSGRSPASSYEILLAGRPAVRVASELPATCDPVRTPCRELPRLRVSRTHLHPAQTFLR